MMKNASLPSFNRGVDVGQVDSEKRTVDLVWTTGARVQRSSWFEGDYNEELSTSPDHVRMDRLNSGAPFLFDHNGQDVAAQPGVVESARLTGGKGIATVRFVKAGVDSKADMLFEKIKDGIVRNVSVGYRVHKFEQTEGGGATVPTFRAVDWEPFEISAVSMGADAGAGFRSEESKKSNECVFITRAMPAQKEKQMDEELKKQQEAQAKREAEIKEEAQRAERTRSADIRAAVRAAKLGDEFADNLVNAGVEIGDARKAVLEELATRDEQISTEQRVRIEAGASGDEKFARAVESALLSRSKVDEIERAKKLGARGFENVDLANGSEFRGMTMRELARECLERKGVKTRGMDPTKLVGTALTHRSGGYAAISDFPVMLENVMNKGLLAAFAVTPDTWSRFCKIEDVQDFRDAHRYRTGSLNSLDSLSENGEFLRKSIPDAAKLSINVATKGNIIGISRQLIINDDMNGLADLMSKLGRAARLSVEEDVYALLAQNSGLGPTQSDTNPFFHDATRSNVSTGAALSVAALDADRVKLAQMMDAEGNEYLDLRPAVLLVPLGLGGAARVLNASAYDHDGSKLQQPNKVQGLFQDIIDTPRLSGTRRYVFASPSVAPAIVVAFLNGQREPVLESQRGWDVDGTEMKVRYDYKAQMFDPKGAITNAGA